MSELQFIHTDYLRLATPVSGIADAPAWLRQLASQSVRQAARNVVDTAIAHDVDFLLIAGGITDSSADLSAATAWLTEQFAKLQSHGIKVVAVADNREEAGLLETICDLVVQSSQRIYASKVHGHSCRVTSIQPALLSDQNVVICVGRQSDVSPGAMVYNAVPATTSSETGNVESRNGRLTVSAGAIQAVDPSETAEFGCVLVHADSEQRALRSNFVVTDVIRFATEGLHLSASTTVDSLATAICTASDSIGKTFTQTVVVDWCVHAELVSDYPSVSSFCETELLQRLRSDVQSGHRGVWPRRIGFTADSHLHVTSTVLDSIEEYIEVVGGAVSIFDHHRASKGQRVVRGESGVDPSLISGLGLLGRVA